MCLFAWKVFRLYLDLVSEKKKHSLSLSLCLFHFSQEEIFIFFPYKTALCVHNSGNFKYLNFSKLHYFQAFLFSCSLEAFRGGALVQGVRDSHSHLLCTWFRRCCLWLLLEITWIAQPPLWEFWSLVGFFYRLFFPPRVQGVRIDGKENRHQSWSHHLVFCDLLKLHVCFIQSNSGEYYLVFPFANLRLISVKLN